MPIGRAPHRELQNLALTGTTLVALNVSFVTVQSFVLVSGSIEWTCLIGERLDACSASQQLGAVSLFEHCHPS